MGKQTTAYRNAEIKSPTPTSEEVDENIIRAVSREAVADLRVKYPVHYHQNACQGPGIFSLRVLYREKQSQNCVSNARFSTPETPVDAQVFRDRRAISKSAVRREWSCL